MGLQPTKATMYGTGTRHVSGPCKKKKKNCRSLARGISHGDKFGNLIKKLQKLGTGYFARGQIREPHKKLQKFGTGYLARGQIREPHRYLRQGCSRQKRQCMALAPGMCVGHAKKKKLQKFGTGYFARGQIREPQKKIAEVWHGVFRTGTNSGTS